MHKYYLLTLYIGCIIMFSELIVFLLDNQLVCSFYMFVQ